MEDATQSLQQPSSTTQQSTQGGSDYFHQQQNLPQKDTSSSTLVYAAITIFVIVILGIGGFLLLSHHKAKNEENNAMTRQSIQNAPITSTQPTPVISPVTSGNVEQTLNNTDSTMQQSMNQANTDLNSVNGIDKSQDNTSGL